MERYLVIKEVGYGAFGNVWRAVNKETGEIVAIKKMKKKYYSWDECLNLREVKSLRKMNHPNIVMLKEVIRENDELYFIFEYMEHNLYEVMKARDEPFSESEIRNLCFQAFQALSYMHRSGYFHRDLKPENLLVSKDVLKVADFGLAREISSKPPFTEYVSTRWYRAPEILLQSSVYGPAVDLWAMGAIMAELFSLRPLFPGINEADEMDKICSVIGSPCQCSWVDGLRLADTIKFRFPQYPGIHLSMLIPSASEYAISLISSLCSWDPHRRPTAAKALQHPFFQPCYYIPPSLRSRDTGISKTSPTAGMKGALDHHSARRLSVGPVPNHKSGSNLCSSTTYSSLKTGGEQRKLDMHPYQDYGPSGERFEQNSVVQPLYRPPAKRNNPAGQGAINHGSRAFEQLVHLPTISSYRVAGMEELLANLTLNSGSQPTKQTLPSFKAGSWHSHTEYLNGSCGGGYSRKVVG